MADEYQARKDAHFTGIRANANLKNCAADDQSPYCVGNRAILANAQARWDRADARIKSYNRDREIERQNVNNALRGFSDTINAYTNAQAQSWRASSGGRSGSDLSCYDSRHTFDQAAAIRNTGGTPVCK
jgi:integrase